MYILAYNYNIQGGVYLLCMRTSDNGLQSTDIYAGRVTDKERSDNGWGFHQFLAHDDLPYNGVKKTQYLKDNHLIVRVVRVKIDV